MLCIQRYGIDYHSEVMFGFGMPSIRGIHDEPTRVRFSLDCAELDPVKQNTQPLRYT